MIGLSQVLSAIRLQDCWCQLAAWGCRQNGALEIMGSALSVPGLQDVIVATLVGMLEWRKHNNKVCPWLRHQMPDGKQSASCRASKAGSFRWIC